MHPQKAHPSTGATTRRGGRRSHGRVIGILIGVSALAVAVPGPAGAAGNGAALDEAAHNEPGTYELDITDRSQALEAIGELPGVAPVSFTDLIASRTGETSECGESCRAWPDDLNTDDRWYPQGLAGSGESNWAQAPATEVLVSAWYERTSPDDHAAVDSALTFVSTDDWRYRTVPLRLPVQTDDGWTTQPLASHNGGVAWAGPYLYVAATDRIHRFDLRTAMTDDEGYFLVPDRTYVGVDQGPYGVPRLSSISTDWTGEPALVSSEYAADDVTTEVVRWPLTDSGDLAGQDGIVGSQTNFWIDKDSSIDKVQGVAAQDGVYLFSGSAGTLDLARVGTQTDRDTLIWGRTGTDTHIPQDLYIGAANVYGQTEEPGHRNLFWQAQEDVLP
ncbi:hypothetical protein OCAE111667_00415 [Occultella aeris]|uniref:Secreted protein n=1 Tax=Occultella aeris TaxID=2761496 RepID=A0A7M4DSN5_9MICO|nr:hypothetical protein [Occultella aeris]VZO40479.1 hypothetical protein HALOF300_05183 [Occultella aeris]